MTNRSEQEGEIPFNIPNVNKSCHTWYHVIGDLASTSATPLITLQGGPGACHEYLLPLRDLSTRHGIPIIFYDQIGNGRSTHLQEKTGDDFFWTEELFFAELDNLIEHLGLRHQGFDLFGHSWGGMFGSTYASQRPQGLRRLVLASAPASIELFLKGQSFLRARLPEDVRQVLDRCEKEERLDSKEYLAACEVFYKQHLCLLDPWPEGVETALHHMTDDPTVYGSMYGPSELVIKGSLRNWTATGRASHIKARTLLINGRHDEVQDVAMEPFFEQIQRVRWVTLEKSSHMGQFEETARYIEILAAFLSGVE